MRDEKAYLSVMHAGVENEGQELAANLGGQLGLTNVPCYNVPPAIVTHAGPGLLGVAFIGK